MNILFYGNCQLDVIKIVLNLDTNIFPNQTSILCFNTELTEQEMKHYVKTSDVIIMNHIHDNYRNRHYLSTTYIIQNAKKSCKIILINNCHFDFYYFDVKSMICEYEITPYHDINLYHCYKQKLHYNYYINNFIENTNLKSKNKLEEIAETSLNELETRYNSMLFYKTLNPNINIISIHDFIKNNYKKKLLFYTINHPSNYLINYICENIVGILGVKNTIKYELDLFNNIRCILYTCIQNVVEFDVTKHTPYIDKKETIREIYDFYYQLYSKGNIDYSKYL